MNTTTTISEIRRLQREKSDGWRRAVRTLVDRLSREHEESAYLPPEEYPWDGMSGRNAMGHLWSERDIAREQRLLPTASGRTDV